MAIINPVTPKILKVRLQHSTTEQFGNGVDVVIGSTGDKLCPVEAVSAFMENGGGVVGPFFIFPDGAPLTK